MSNPNSYQLNIPQARETGSVGGQTVKKCVPYERRNTTEIAGM